MKNILFLFLLFSTVCTAQENNSESKKNEANTIVTSMQKKPSELVNKTNSSNAKNDEILNPIVSKMYLTLEEVLQKNSVKNNVKIEKPEKIEQNTIITKMQLQPLEKNN